MRKWIKPLEPELGPRNGHFFNVNQVTVIFEKLGIPERNHRQKRKVDPGPGSRIDPLIKQASDAEILQLEIICSFSHRL